MLVVGIDVNEESQPGREFRVCHKVTYPIALDSQRAIFKFFVFKEFPAHVFLDGSRAISCVSVRDLSPDEMDNEVAVAIDRVPISSPSDRSALPQGRPSTSPVPSR